MKRQSVFDSRTGDGFFQIGLTDTHSAALVGAEGQHELAGKIMGLQKGEDRHGIVPHRQGYPRMITS